MNYQSSNTEHIRVLLNQIHDTLNTIQEQDFQKSLLKSVHPFLYPHDPEKAPQFWEAALSFGQHFSDRALCEETRTQLKGLVKKIRDYQGWKALYSPAPVKVIFGTSGWRDRIGDGMTVLNVHRAVRAIIEMMKTKVFLSANQLSTFEAVQTRGIVVFRDNRFMGDVFMLAAKKELASAKIKIYDAGECPTGVGSALVTELKAAGSINFTPSHNPMDWTGLKFNPADGGPAGKDITTIIDQLAEPIMAARDFVPADLSEETLSHAVIPVDAKVMYRDFLEKSVNFDLPAIRQWLLDNKKELMLVVDYFHGSARGFVEFVLGDDVIKDLKASQSIEFWHTEDDVSFEGKKPEPSAVNQRPIIEKLKNTGRRLTLGVFMDPDADRIRFCDAARDIEMNLFGPIMYANLLQAGINGGVVTSVASSDFGFAIAKASQQPVFETSVGFKWFRSYITDKKVVLAFEESDGISLGDTLEKDALAGFFGALVSMMRSGQNLSEQYAALQQRYGYYYPQKTGVELRGITPEEWKEYQTKVLKVLQQGLFVQGQTVFVGSVEKNISEIVIDDGLKLVFTDHSWILMRPSGTEPKFRIYYEITSQNPLSDSELIPLMEAYKKAGSEILEIARNKV